MKIKILLGIVISIAFLVFAFSQVDINEFWKALKTANYAYFIAAAIVSVSIFLIRAYRWKYFLYPQENISFPVIFSATSIGFFGNNVLPMRIGEFIRAYVLARNTTLSTTGVLASILIERIIDVLSLLFIAAGGLLFLPIPRNESFYAIKGGAISLFAVEVAVIVFCVAVIWKKDLTISVVNKILQLFPKKISKMASLIVESFISGLEGAKQIKHFGRIIISSFGIWFISLMQLLLIMNAFDLTVSTSILWISALVALIFSSFALIIPSSPGFVGPYHAAIMAGLMLFSIDESTALGIAFLMHFSGYIPITVIGFSYFQKENVKLSTINEAKTTT